MANAFAATLAGERPMLLIGTDCPAQTAADLEAAIAALREADAVIQPAEDGGYVLIGMKTFHPALFEQVAWGSDDGGSRPRARVPPIAAFAWRSCRRAGISIGARTSIAPWPSDSSIYRRSDPE